MQRNVVRQPELSLQVLDNNQQPISNAKIVLYWWSNPYSSLQERQQFTTDSQGLINLPETLQTDTAFPLMIHGVQEFHHTLCIEAVDYRSLLMTLSVLPKDKIILKASMTLGDSLSICNDFETVYGHPGTIREDIKGQHPSLKAAYEITELR